ncbi:MAG: Gfo/Idh/MocA family oxidoreductase [Candidatus Lustribacter sp.]
MRVGFIGLGQAAALILERIRAAGDPRWQVVAGADPREHARETFAREYGCNAYADAAGLVRDENVDVVYIATPPALHLEHASLAARAGKHAIVEKPLTLKLDEARQMVAVAAQTGTKLLAGHTHSFDAPIRAMQRLVESGELGPLRAINSWNFNEFNHRPRLHSELVDTHGPVFNQGPHHVDIVRQIAGGLVRSVRGTTIPDGITGVEGGYVAYLEFVTGVPATLVYDGRSLFDTAEFFEWRGEGGGYRDPETNAVRRRAFLELAGTAPGERDALLDAQKESGRYGAVQYQSRHPAEESVKQPFFGLTVVSCENATVRQSPGGLYVYGPDGRREVRLERAVGGRLAELAEMHRAIATDTTPEHDGAWGLATLEVCTGMLESARTGAAVEMQYQVPTPPAAQTTARGA